MKLILYKGGRIQRFRFAVTSDRNNRKSFCVVCEQKAAVRGPLFYPVRFVVAIDALRLLSCNFDFLNQERRINSAVRKKIERDIVRIRRPNRIRLRMRIDREWGGCIRRQINQPQTAGSVLVERVQRQVFYIRRKRELLKIDNRVEGSSHGAVACIPVELIER